jgi:hypothetical protein
MDKMKPRVIKDYDKLDPEIQEQIKLEYPYGFSDNLITFTNKDGLIVSALPFETEDKYYMVRMTVSEAIKIVEDDDDFDDDGTLKAGIKEEYATKYGDVPEEIANDLEVEMDDDDDYEDVADEEYDDDDDEEADDEDDDY